LLHSDLQAYSIHFSFTSLQIDIIYRVSFTSNQVLDTLQEKVNSKQAVIPKFIT